MESSIKACKQYIGRKMAEKPMDYIAGADTAFCAIDFYGSLMKRFPERAQKYDIVKGIMDMRIDHYNKSSFDEGVRDVLTRIEVAAALGPIVDDKGEPMKFLSLDFAEDSMKRYIETARGGKP